MARGQAWRSVRVGTHRRRRRPVSSSGLDRPVATSATSATGQEWLRGYAMLALRINRHVTGTTGGTVLIYRGPGEWSAEVESEAPPPAGRLVEDADRLLDDLPSEPRRAAYLAAQ